MGDLKSSEGFLQPRSTTPEFFSTRSTHNSNNTEIALAVFPRTIALAVTSHPSTVHTVGSLESTEPTLRWPYATPEGRSSASS